MTSIGNYKRQVSSDSAYFIGTAPLLSLIFTSPLGSIAPWASTGAAAVVGGGFASTVSTSGALLRDMGKTVVSSGAYFRKVQLVVPQGTTYATAGTTSTFGVAGPAPNGGGTNTAPPDYLTGYIKLGFEGQGAPAPVAKYGL
jgi:hypothetical protein